MSLDPSLAAASDDELLEVEYKTATDFPNRLYQGVADLSEPMDYGDSVLMAACIQASAVLSASPETYLPISPAGVMAYARRLYQEAHKEVWHQ